MMMMMMMMITVMVMQIISRASRRHRGLAWIPYSPRFCFACCLSVCLSVSYVCTYTRVHVTSLAPTYSVWMLCNM